jgi:hypothetical protein
MYTNKNWLALAAVVGLALVATANAKPFDADKKDDAPADAPGSIGAILRMRDKLPRGSAPTTSEVVLKDDMLEVTRQVMYQTLVTEEVIMEQDGKPVKAIRTVTVPRIELVKQGVAVKAIKSFVVTKEGKLEALDAEKLADAIKKPTRVLLGDSAEVDPRYLELIKPGTIYLAVPQQTGAPVTPVIPPMER